MNFFPKLFVLALLMPASVIATEVIHYDGDIESQAVARFIKKYQNSDASILTINSSGGEVEAGIRLGHWLFERKMDVVVDGVCLSSCANYIFTAARKKTLTSGSVVGWHGNYHHLEATGLWRDDVELRMQRDGEDVATATSKVRTQLEKLLGLEKTFFARTGVNEFLCWVGKTEPYNVADYYTLSAANMSRFGVDRVSLPASYSDTDFSRFDVDVRFIRLDID